MSETQTGTILRREVVAHHLGIAPEALAHYERLGLIRAVDEGGAAGYEPGEIRRIWSVVSYHRDLGVNLAGVELILRMRDRMEELHLRVLRLAHSLERALDEADGDG